MRTLLVFSFDYIVFSTSCLGKLRGVPIFQQPFHWLFKSHVLPKGTSGVYAIKRSGELHKVKSITVQQDTPPKYEVYGKFCCTHFIRFFGINNIHIKHQWSYSMHARLHLTCGFFVLVLCSTRHFAKSHDTNCVVGKFRGTMSHRLFRCKVCIVGNPGWQYTNKRIGQGIPINHLYSWNTPNF